MSQAPITAIRLLGTAAIAIRYELTREYVTDTLTKRADFPPPRLNLNRKVRKWGEDDLEAWEKKQARR